MRGRGSGTLALEPVENRHASEASGFSTAISRFFYPALSVFLEASASLLSVTSASRPLLRCAAAVATPLAPAAAVAGSAERFVPRPHDGDENPGRGRRAGPAGLGSPCA